MNLDTVDYAYVKKMIARLTNGLSMIVQSRGGADCLFRVRRGAQKKISNISEILSPPPSAVSNYQRCNAPGEPLFYAASTRMAAIKESRTECGEIIYLGQWINHTNYPVNVVLMSDISNYNFVYREAEKVLYPYFDAIFTRRVHSTFSNDYKLTSALSEQLMTRVPKEIKGVGDDGLVAMKYPSVANLGSNIHNTVMHPDFVKKHIQLKHLMEAEVIKKGDDVSLKILDTATVFSDGIINWTEKKYHIPYLRQKNDTILFFNDNGTASLAMLQEEPDEYYIDRLLID